MEFLTVIGDFTGSLKRPIAPAYPSAILLAKVELTMLVEKEFLLSTSIPPPTLPALLPENVLLEMLAFPFSPNHRPPP
jgi:hypothetical protein